MIKDEYQEAENMQGKEEKLDLANDLPDAEAANAVPGVTPEQQQQEIEELSARLVRLQADFDNYRRRSRQEITEMARFGAERIILSLLPVIDNFERALAAAQGNEQLSQFVAGMELIYRQLQEALEKEGLSVIPAANEPFNPEKHHAVAQVETDVCEENMVVDVLHKGYALHEKVLRPSAVRVAVKPDNQEI